MRVGALSVRCREVNGGASIIDIGRSESRGLCSRELPRSLPALDPKMSSKRLSRSSYLWRRVRSLSNFSRAVVTESGVVNWLDARLRGAEFGCLSLREVRASAERELGVSDDELFALLARHVVGDGRFKSDGVVMWLREASRE